MRQANLSSGFSITNPLPVTLPVGQAVELLDSAGTNKASISAAGAVKVDGSAVVQPVSGTVTANQGTAAALASAWPVEITDGTNGPVAVKAASTAAVAADKAQVVVLSPNNPARIAGIAGASIDAANTIGTAPTNGILALTACITNAPPVLANGQSIGAQCDNNGSIFVKPFRRSQTVAQATTIALSAAATTILAASGIAGIFRDLTKLVISVTPLAAGVAAITFTATLSDGTNNYIFDMQADQTGTAVLVSNPSPPLNLDFNPALPAATANTVWTLTLSVNTVTVHVVAMAVRQAAS
jgi:hypothetical protein